MTTPFRSLVADRLQAGSVALVRAWLGEVARASPATGHAPAAGAGAETEVGRRAHNEGADVAPLEGAVHGRASDDGVAMGRAAISDDDARELISAVATDLAEPGPGGLDEALRRARRQARDCSAAGAPVAHLVRHYDRLEVLLQELIVAQAQAVDPAPSAGDVAEAMSAVRDSFQRLAAAAVTAHDEARGQAVERHERELIDFNRMVSHELRNPLNTLRLALEVLDTADPGPRERERIFGKIRASVERMGRILRSIERLSALVSSELESAELEDVDLEQLVDGVVEQVGELASELGVEIRTAASFPVALAEAASLQLALRSVVTNAIEYSDPEKPERFVEILAETPQNDNRVTLLVRDNGIGIATEDLPRIFDRFFRANREHAKRRGVSGLGLGLTMARECVAVMNGDLQVQSEAGKGTSVWITLPRSDRETTR